MRRSFPFFFFFFYLCVDFVVNQYLTRPDPDAYFNAIKASTETIVVSFEERPVLIGKRLEKMCWPVDPFKSAF